MQDEFMTVEEFAKLMRMHYNSIIKSIQNGRINAFRIGIGKKSPFRIPRSEIYRIAEMDLGEIIDNLIAKKLNETESIQKQKKSIKEPISQKKTD